MTHSSMNWSGWSGLVYLRSAKFHYVEETHIMLVTFGFGERYRSISAQKLTKKSLSRFVDENTDSDIRVHELHYANELLVRVRLSFKKKFAKSPNKQKHG